MSHTGITFYRIILKLKDTYSFKNKKVGVSKNPEHYHYQKHYTYFSGEKGKRTRHEQEFQDKTRI